MVQYPTTELLYTSDYIQSFRNRNIMILGLATAPFLVPFAVYNFFAGRPVVGTLLAGLTVIALANAVGVWRLKRRLVPIWIYFSLGLIALAHALATVGVTVSYWSYPACFSLLFLGERREARALMALTVAVLLPTAFLTMPMEIAVRFTATLAMVCFFSDLVVGIFTNMQLQLTHLAVRDPLTGALNRRQMTSYLEEAIEERHRGLGPVCAVVLDVDDFKSINDNCGHERGDQVLQRLVKTIRARKRRLDPLFRVGGEEFALLLRNTPLDSAVCFAEDLRAHIESAPLLDGRPVTVSLGVAEHTDEESTDSWLRRADKALYQAKHAGRNCVRTAQLPHPVESTAPAPI